MIISSTFTPKTLALCPEGKQNPWHNYKVLFFRSSSPTAHVNVGRSGPMALHNYPGLNWRVKLKEGQATLPGLLGLEKSYDILGGNHDSVQSQGGSGAFKPLILPEGHLPIITAGGQKPTLLGVPGYTVDILGMGLRQVRCQGKDGLLWI